MKIDLSFDINKSHVLVTKKPKNSVIVVNGAEHYDATALTICLFIPKKFKGKTYGKNPIGAKHK